MFFYWFSSMKIVDDVIQPRLNVMTRITVMVLNVFLFQETNSTADQTLTDR